MRFCRIAPVVLGLCFSSAIAYSQAEATATQKFRIDAFGMLSYVRPDFGGALKNAGGTVGADVSMPGFGRWEPGLEFRALGSGGRVSNQYLYSGGPRLTGTYGRFMPYADLLIGYGTIKYNRPDVFNGVPYTQDNSLVYAYGGGLDYVVARHWALRADVLAQRWKVGQNDAAFHPLAMSVGVRYRFHFHSKTSPGE